MDVTLGDTNVKVELQHLDYNHLIGRGYISPVAILKLFEIADYTEDPLSQTSGERLHTRFMIWQQLEIHPHFYNLPIPKNMNDLQTLLNRKVEIFQKYFRVGNSSKFFRKVMRDGTAKEPLASVTGKLVNVDLETRKPTPFSKAYKEYINTSTGADFIKIDEKIPHKCTNFYEMPKNVKIFQHSAQVVVFQVDNNCHLNSASHISHCFDCLAQALQEGFTTNMKHPIWNYPLKRVSILYLKECFMGDKVTTVVWQDDSDEWVFHFHLRKADIVASQVELEFYPENFPLISSKL